MSEQLDDENRPSLLKQAVTQYLVSTAVITLVLIMVRFAASFNFAVEFNAGVIFKDILIWTGFLFALGITRVAMRYFRDE